MRRSKAPSSAAWDIPVSAAPRTDCRRVEFVLDVAGLAAYPAEIFETIVIRLKLIIGNAPILNRQIRTTGFEKLFPVALQDVRSVDEVQPPARGQLWPFQCTNEPPRPVRGKKLSQRRIGSAVWSELLRKVTAPSHCPASSLCGLKNAARRGSRGDWKSVRCRVQRHVRARPLSVCFAARAPQESR